MDGEQIAEREIVTPTVAALRLSATSRGAKNRRPYLFVIDEHDLHKLCRAGIPVTACIVYAVIQSAAKAAGQDWITLSPRAMDALRHSYRWWWRQTELLEKAGFVETERQRGAVFRAIDCARSQGPKRNSGPSVTARHAPDRFRLDEVAIARIAYPLPSTLCNASRYWEGGRGVRVIATPMFS